MKKYFKYLNNEKGLNVIIAIIIVTPFLVWLSVVLIFSGSFLLKKSNMTTIVNKALDEALVEGQFTTALQQSLKNELIDCGFNEEDKLEITITPTAAGDNDNNTYIKRGNTISLNVAYKKPDKIYYVLFKSSDESNYYIRVKTPGKGMSEKW